MPHILSVNVGTPTQNPYKRLPATGHDKRPVDGPVRIFAPGPVKGFSGVAGDVIGDAENHGGNDQAVYAFAREDLDRWQSALSRDLPNGSFGENLTTVGIDGNSALIGEQWRIGREVVLEITGPRIPCATFQGIIGRRTWLKEFVRDGRPGPYFRVLSEGVLSAGDEIIVMNRPAHGISVAVAFRSVTTDRTLVSRILAVADQLPPDLVEFIAGFEPTGDLTGK